MSEKNNVLEQAIDSIVDYVFYKDLEGRYIGCNKSFELWAGLKKEDLIGLTDTDVFKLLPEEANYYQENDRKVIQNRQTAELKRHVPFSDGSWRFIETKLTPLVIDDKVVGIIGIGRDITEKEIMDQEENITWNFYDEMIESSPNAIDIWDDNFNILYCNDTCVKLFGVDSKQEYIENFLSFSPLLQPNGEQSTVLARKYIDECIEIGEKHFYWDHQNKKGDLIKALVTLVKVKYNKTFRIVGYIRDLTNEFIYRDELEKEKITNQLLLDSTPLVCTLWNENCKIVSCNIACVDLFELTSKKEFSENFYMFSPLYQPNGQLSKETSLKLLLETFKNGYSRFEWIHKKLNGELIPAQITMVRVQIDNKNFIAAYLRDLREEKIILAKNIKAENKTRLLFEALPIASCFYDQKLNMVDCNNQTLKIFKQKSKKQFLKNISVINPEYQPDGKKSIEKRANIFKEIIKNDFYKYEWTFIDSEGVLIPSEVIFVKVIDDDGSISFVAYLNDITEKIENLKLLETASQKANHDSLTSLFNRGYFQEIYDKDFSSYNTSILMLDLDNFKNINDKFGHLVGDYVLKSVAEILNSFVNENVIVSRYGGEEFIVGLKNYSFSEVRSIAEAIRMKVQNAVFERNGIFLQVTVSGGIATNKYGSIPLTRVVSLADEMLYKAKKNGRNKIEMFNE